MLFSCIRAADRPRCSQHSQVDAYLAPVEMVPNTQLTLENVLASPQAAPLAVLAFDWNKQLTFGS